MDKLKRLQSNIQASWTYKHPQLLVITSLCVVCLVQTFGLPQLLPQVSAVEYKSNRCAIECQLEDRARQLYKEHELMDLERYRQKALQEYGNELIELSDASPFVDYEALKNKWGY